MNRDTIVILNPDTKKELLLAVRINRVWYCQLCSEEKHYRTQMITHIHQHIEII